MYTIYRNVIALRILRTSGTFCTDRCWKCLQGIQMRMKVQRPGRECVIHVLWCSKRVMRPVKVFLTVTIYFIFKVTDLKQISL